VDASLLSALSALVGAVIGGLASFFASFFAQREQARARWIDQDRTRRQEVYKDFIEEASKCYADALQHDEADVPELVGLFATIGRMRVLSSRKVLAIAEELGRKILDIYRQPNKSFSELLEMANDKSFDLLRDFTEACREEFETMRAQQF
jgi:hypothetical protein